jgi:hypothetical protein
MLLVYILQKWFLTKGAFYSNIVHYKNFRILFNVAQIFLHLRNLCVHLLTRIWNLWRWGRLVMTCNAKCHGRVSRAHSLFSGTLGFKSRPGDWISWAGFVHRFPQSLHTDTAIMIQSGKDGIFCQTLFKSLLTDTLTIWRYAGSEVLM